MQCKYCGRELIEDANYCNNCGAKIENEVIVEEEKVERQPLKCWSIFARTSKILGIISLCICFIPIFGLFGTLTGVPGIVFGILGKKANNDEAISNARRGFVTSLIGTIISIAFYIFIYILIIVIGILASTY